MNEDEGEDERTSSRRREEGKKGTESKEGPLGTGAGAGGTFEKQKKKRIMPAKHKQIE